MSFWNTWRIGLVASFQLGIAIGAAWLAATLATGLIIIIGGDEVKAYENGITLCIWLLTGPAAVGALLPHLKAIDEISN